MPLRRSLFGTRATSAGGGGALGASDAIGALELASLGSSAIAVAKIAGKGGWLGRQFKNTPLKMLYCCTVFWGRGRKGMGGLQSAVRYASKPANQVHVFNAVVV